MQKAISIFKNSAGALLLASASALFLINWTNPPDYMPPHDPIFLMSLNKLFWILGGICLLVACLCFFSGPRTLPLLLLAWVAFNYLVCRIGLSLQGCHSLAGYLGGFAHAFSISAGATATMADVTFVYLLTGSCIALHLLRRLPPALQFQKMPCPSCGGRVKFPIENLGQKIDCPHCKVPVSLRKPEELLKSSCFFCKEHIQFPAHALGRKIKCPHCKMEIGLREESA